MNSLGKFLPLRLHIQHIITALVILFCINLQAQNIPYNDGKKYTLGDITVSGNTSFGSETIVAYSGLRKAQN